MKRYSIFRRILIGIAVAILLLLFALLIPIAYLRLGCSGESALPTQIVHAVPRSASGTVRSEDQTYLTLPEWYIVYSTDELAAFLKSHPAHQFPYFAAIGQYWKNYCQVYSLTNRYTFNSGYHTALYVIGMSLTVEYGLKGTYEKTTGALTALLSEPTTDEDRFAARVAADYAAFIHAIPFYEYPYGREFFALWLKTSFFGPHILRKWERKFILSLEYSVKGFYGSLIRMLTHAAYAPEKEVVHLTIASLPQVLLREEPRIQVIGHTQSGMVITLPRYEPFTQIVVQLAARGVHIREIAGNDDILVTLIADRSWTYDLSDGQFLFALDILTNPEKKRMAVRVPVASLHRVLPELQKRGITIEHLYDY